MNPINYNVEVVNPLKQDMQGYRIGATQRNDQQAQQDALLKQQAAKQMQADLNVLATNPNASAKDYAAMMVKHPSISEDIKRSFETMDKGRKDSTVKAVSQTYAAVRSGNIDLAKEMMQTRIDAAKKSGNDEEAASVQAMLKVLEINPKAAETTLGIALSATTGADKFAETLAKLDGNKREEELQGGKVVQQGADLNKTLAQTMGIGADTKATLDKNKREEGLQSGKIAQQGADLNNTNANTQKTLGDDARSQQLQSYKIKDILSGIQLRGAQASSARASAYATRNNANTPKPVSMSNRKKLALEAGLEPGTKEFNKFLLRDTSNKINIEKPFSEGQAKLALFSSMSDSVKPVINRLEEKLSSGDIATNLAGDNAFTNTFLRSEEYQQYKSAANQWGEGYIRITTGAAAPDAEVARAFKTFFPQVGDTKPTIKFKQQQRQAFEHAIKVAGQGRIGKATDGDFSGFANDNPKVNKLPANVQKALDMYQ